MLNKTDTYPRPLKMCKTLNAVNQYLIQKASNLILKPGKLRKRSFESIQNLSLSLSLNRKLEFKVPHKLAILKQKQKVSYHHAR